MVDFELHDMAGHLIRTCQQAHSSLWSAEFSGLMTSPQFAVLHILAHEEPLRQTTLRNRACLDRSTAAAIIQRLMDRRWIDRVRDPHDGRRNLIGLTETGREIYADAAHRAWQVNETLLQAVGEHEGKELVRLLDTLRAHHRQLLESPDESSG